MTAMPANAARGEVAVEIGGEARRACLTLGALAEIESSLGVKSIRDLGERLEDPSADDLVLVLMALLKGGGEEISEADLRAAPLRFDAAMAAVTRAFEAAGAGGGDAPPGPTRGAGKTARKRRSRGPTGSRSGSA